VSSPPRRLPAFLAPAARRALRDRAATGELRLEGKVFELAPGDAVVFRSDQITHQVSPVVGERLVLSVGCVY
jgi:hypothetical protein